MRKRRCAFGAALLAALLVSGSVPAGAEPLRMAEDLAAEIREPLHGGAEYIYTYRYPQADPEDPSAGGINSFYQYRAEDAEGFEIPMNADYYRSQGTDRNIEVEISYRITCNRDDYFSVLISTRQEELMTWTGHTFSRRGLRAGSTVALPYLLGILDSGESDTWLQDRQTARADELVREMVWERLEEMDGLRAELTEEDLAYGFFPEEDFYLDENGNPVFYLQPGFAMEGGGLTEIPITLEEILDEM